LWGPTSAAKEEEEWKEKFNYDVTQSWNSPNYSKQHAHLIDHIALGRLSQAKAADAFFTLIRPEFYRQTPRVIWWLKVQTAVIGSASSCLRPLEGAKKFGAIFKQCQ
jgi:hypothetical protein